MANTRKIWTPATGIIPNNLANWKQIMQDVHDSMILAGLVQMPDAGQLDIGAVSVLPAKNTFAGYGLYRFNDALQDDFPIIVKIEYGTGWNSPSEAVGYESDMTPRLACSVGVAVDSSGNFIGGRSYRHFYPSEYASEGAGQHTQTLNQPGTSIFCNNEDAGFFGIALGIGSRNVMLHEAYNGYPLSTLVLMVQRAVNAQGQPTAEGFCVFGPKVTTNAYYANPGAGSVSVASYVSNAPAVQSSRWAPRVDGVLTASAGGEVGMQPVYMRTPHIRRHPNLLTYTRTDLVDFTQHPIEVAPGVTKNFIALGGASGMHSDEISNYAGAFAMLFEGTDL